MILHMSDDIIRFKNMATSSDPPFVLLRLYTLPATYSRSYSYEDSCVFKDNLRRVLERGSEKLQLSVTYGITLPRQLMFLVRAVSSIDIILP